MDINELKPGNLIKVQPRENQEGLLLVQEIQHSTVICEMISPRKGYLFRLKPVEITPVPISDYWLTKAGYTPGMSSGYWSDSRGAASYLSKNNEGRLDHPDSVDIKYVHELQNEYLRLTASTLTIIN